MLKKTLLTILKIIIPIGFGIILIYWVYKQLAPEEKIHLFSAFHTANYTWILLSVFFGILSHLSRAYRWKFLMEPLCLKPLFWNSFFSVMIGYGVNLLLPRVGEVTRCGIMSKYNKMPFDKLFGTVIAERVADMIILISLVTIVIITQFPVLKETLYELLNRSGLSDNFILILACFIGVFIIIVAGLFFPLKRSKSQIATRIKKLIRGFIDGLFSIVKMKNSLLFIGYTILIWALYLVMFYICFFSLPGTSNAPISGVLAAFVIGGLSIVFIQGGIGVYPAAVMGALAYRELPQAQDLRWDG